MMSRSPKTAIFIIALIALPWVSLIPSPIQAESKTPTFTLPLFSDFDGDHNVDSAELSTQGSFKRIHVTLGTSLTKLLSFDSRDADRGLLFSSDLDRDGDLDLIWISKNDPQHFVAWRGDGHGNFSKDRALANDANPVQALLRDSTRDVTGVPAATDLIAVLQSTTIAGILPASDPLPVRPSAHGRPITFSADASTQFFSVVYKRGPPSQNL